MERPVGPVVEGCRRWRVARHVPVEAAARLILVVSAVITVLVELLVNRIKRKGIVLVRPEILILWLRDASSLIMNLLYHLLVVGDDGSELLVLFSDLAYFLEAGFVQLLEGFDLSEGALSSRLQVLFEQQLVESPDLFLCSSM